jgi:hypothetical protein
VAAVIKAAAYLLLCHLLQQIITASTIGLGTVFMTAFFRYPDYVSKDEPDTNY